LKEDQDGLRWIQILCDEDGHNDWMLEFSVDIDASRESGKPVMILREFCPVS
jgi:hypothetical protein